MLTLTDDLLIGSGRHRQCFRHPTDNSRCVKVFFDGFSKEFIREQKYYKRLQHTPAVFEHIPRYYGEFATNRGEGSVFDLIEDDDGAVSRTLDSYLAAVEDGEQALDELIPPLLELKDFMLRFNIITTDLHSRNIACLRQGGEFKRYYLIDDIGNPEFIPICNYSSYFAHRKVKRKWKRFEKKIGLSQQLEL